MCLYCPGTAVKQAAYAKKRTNEGEKIYIFISQRFLCIILTTDLGIDQMITAVDLGK